MKALLLLVIRLYWALVPEDKRRTCIFRISCSRQVYQETKTKGLRRGLAALKYRYQNCRSGYHVFEHPVYGDQRLRLPNGQLLSSHQIAQRFSNHIA